MNRTIFPSRVDIWLVAVPLVTLGFMLFLAVVLHDSAPFASLIVMVSAALVVVVIGLVTVPCRYVLEAEHLLIRFGIFQQRVAYRQITGVELSSSPRTAPALSLQRIKVSYGTSFQLISPRDREWFIRALEERIGATTGRMPAFKH